MNSAYTIESVKEETEVIEMLKERIEIQSHDDVLCNACYDDEDDEELVEIEENKVKFDKPPLTLLYLVKQALHSDGRKIYELDIHEDTEKLLNFIIIANPSIIHDFEKVLDIIYFSSEESLVYKVKKIMSSFSYLYSFSYPHKNDKKFIKMPLADCCGSLLNFLIDVYIYKNASTDKPVKESNFERVPELIEIIVGVSKLNKALEEEDKIYKRKFLKIYNKTKDMIHRMFSKYCCK
jgi:hypothetical protein